MTTQSDPPRSRRALLTAGLAAGVATVAASLGRPSSTNAADGDPVIIGGFNTAANTTTIKSSFKGLDVESTYGFGIAISGVASNVAGDPSIGVGGWAYGANGVGVYGQAATGVTGNGSGATSVGVAGYGPGADSVGVLGDTRDGAGVGVRGKSKSNAAIYGTSTTSNGVSGSSVSGNGVYATTSGSGSALNVAGKAKFSRSGRATVAANRSYADITVAGGLTSHSVIHATLQTYRSGVSIAAVRANYPTAGKARIYLTKVASTTAITYVGWFVAEY